MRIVRLLAQRLRSRLGLVKSANVLDHGADPTGRWDSANAIRRAAATLSATGGTVYVPSGIYDIRKTQEKNRAAAERDRRKGNEMTTVRESRLSAAREAILDAFHDTPASAWDGKLNSSVSIPPGMNMGPYFDRMAEAVVDALFTDRSMDHITVATAAEREAAEYLPGDGIDHKRHPIVDREDTRSPFPEEVTEGDITVTIYKSEGAFVVADQAGWLPGSFPTRDAALAAARSENGLT